MFIFLNALVASLDGLIIGIGLKLAKTKLTMMNKLIIFLTNIFIYSIIIFLYYSLKIKFMTMVITTLLYLFLAWNAYHTKEDEEYEKSLSIKKTIFIAATHSLDGSIVSLNFVYNYNILFIILLFSFFSILLLICGYMFAKLLSNIKKSNLINALLFLALAIINLFL